MWTLGGSGHVLNDWVLPPHGNRGWSNSFPVSAWPTQSSYRHLESKPVNRSVSTISLALCPSKCKTNKQTKNTNWDCLIFLSGCQGLRPALILTQLIANMYMGVQDLSNWVPPTHGLSSWLLASTWPAPSHYSHLGTESVGRKSACFCPSFK